MTLEEKIKKILKKYFWSEHGNRINKVVRLIMEKLNDQKINKTS